ncbi:hypothetical protein BP6252_11379 [Coleophoma cylindrospora]|uniref:Major facilitator superfamily (MFS) profile domain-containing protein n=1 Tax=Coleophoma cylindrospora TaxID=1849047 RepID=A0A3D8QJE4_9HELO|nr:hypothetical protein BP6252_11379 [Coleophoma cylindrospora]
MEASSTYIRGTSLGQLLRLISNGKILRYPEEDDSSLYASSLVKSIASQTEGPIDERERQQHRNTLHEQQGTIEDPEPCYRQSNPLRIVCKSNNVEWYGPDDPENPTNWSSVKKLFVTCQLCFLNLVVYMGSSIYSSGELGVMNHFDVSEVVVTLGLTLFVLGYGFGPMLWSPMSGIPKIGRNPIYIWTLAVFVVLQIPIALATNISMILVFRFITGDRLPYPHPGIISAKGQLGFFGSPIFATGGASISDMYMPSNRAYGIAIWGALGVCGPVLGPLVGGFLSESLGWTWTIWSLMCITGFAFVVCFVFLPETSGSSILYHRAQRIRNLTQDKSIRTQVEDSQAEISLMRSIHTSVVEAFSLTFLEPIILFVNLYVALVYGLLYVWFESFDIVFIGVYSFSLGEEGLCFLGILIGGVVVVPLYLWYYHVKIRPEFSKNGDIRPEEFIPPACIGGFAIPICLFWFGWTARESIHWVVPVAGSAFFTFGVVLLFNPVLNYLGATYPQHAASVFGGNAFVRSTFGAAFPLFVRAS